MKKLNNLLKCLSSSDYQLNYANAKAGCTCIMYCKKADEFRSPSHRLEYFAIIPAHR